MSFGRTLVFAGLTWFSASVALAAPIEASWSMRAFAGFVSDYSPANMLASEGMSGFQIPSVLVLAPQGALMVIKSPDELESGDLLHGAQLEGDALDVLLEQLDDGAEVASRINREWPTLVLFTVDLEQCGGCRTAPEKIAALMAKDGRRWNIIYATASGP